MLRSAPTSTSGMQFHFCHLWCAHYSSCSACTSTPSAQFIGEVRMTAHEVRAPQPQARNSTSVICGMPITVCEIDRQIVVTGNSVEVGGCRLMKNENLNFRHAIPLLSFVVRAIHW